MHNQFEHINSFFDKIYIISIARATERHEKIELHLQGLNYELLFGIDKNDLNESLLIEQHIYDKDQSKKHHLWNQPMLLGQIACSWSHKKVYELQIKNGYQKVLVLEDDVIINQVGVDLFPKIIQELPPNWDLVYFDYHKRTESNFLSKYRTVVYMLQHYIGKLNWTAGMIKQLYAKPYSEHVRIAGYHEYTSAYAITLSTAQKLLKLQTPISFVADNLLGYAITNKFLTAYLTVPKLFEQESQQLGGNTFSYVTDSYDNGL